MNRWQTPPLPKGMKINEGKTGLMCVSAALGFEPRVKIALNGQEITGTKSMKILGMTLDSNYGLQSRVRNVGQRIGAKSWALTKLRKAGLSTDRLLRAYKGFIRPVAEYVSPAWHSSLAAFLEKQQSQSLRNIFGFGLSASKMRKTAEIPLLSTRRLQACKKFAEKNINNPRCGEFDLI